MHIKSGKLPAEPILDRDCVPRDSKSVSNIFQIDSNCSEAELNFYNNYSKPVLSYLFAQANDTECPYISVSIYGTKINGLLDSGANKIFLGEKGYNILLSKGVKLQKSNSGCKVANGEIIDCIGYMTIPIQLQDKVHVFDCHVMPQLRHTIVLGTVFWIKMGIIPDLRKGEWFFGSKDENCQVNSIHTADDLTLEQKGNLNSIVDDYFESIKDIKLGCTDLTEHEIKTDSPPIRSKYYPVSPLMQQKIDEEVTNMLDLGVIEKSESPWSSPILMIPKSDGKSYRFCVDFRKLNAVTEKWAYPLPFINSILDRLGNAKYLSTLDIKSAYWQVKMTENSKKYTAFAIPGRGHFQFKRLAFGLTNAPSTFQALVDKLFGPELEPFVFKYLDDLVIVTPDFETHMRILKEVFKRLKLANLTLNRDKCNFCRNELKYVGYIVNRAGLSVDPEKVSAVVDMIPPKTPKQVRSFVGMVSYYRRFIPCLSETIVPLTSLTKKNVKFKWTPECQIAFEKIKNALVSAPILSCPNFKESFVLHCDASSYGIGAVLTQEYGGKIHVICYISRTLNKCEVKYSVTEKELLCVIWAIEKCRCYLELSEFVIVTDHSSLSWINNLKNPQGRLGRWTLRLQQYNFKVVHRPGKDNVVPDCLSRFPIGTDCIDSIDFKEDESDKCAWYVDMCERVREHPLKYPVWRVSDEGMLYKYVNDNNFYEPYDKWKIVVSKPQRSQILYNAHNDPKSGHLGIYKTYNKILSKYFWPKMKSDVVNYIRKCRICAEQKPEQKKVAGQMGVKPDINRCWQYISTDLIGPFPRSTLGHRFVLVVVDYFSKFTLLFPLRTATAKNVAKLIEDNVFLMFGVPEFLRSDNGGQYKSKEFENLLKDYDTVFITNPLYDPSPNFTERYNRVIKTMIRSFIDDNQKYWDKYLQKLACAIRSAKSEITQNTPYFVNFGYEMNLSGSDFKQQRKKLILEPNVNDSNENLNNNQGDTEKHIKIKSDKLKEIHLFVKKRLEKAHLTSTHNYNLRHRPVQFQEGQLVWKREYNLSDKSKNYSAKLDKKFSGPYKIKKKLGVSTYELIDEKGKSLGKWNVKDLKIDMTQSEEQPEHRKRQRRK